MPLTRPNSMVLTMTTSHNANRLSWDTADWLKELDKVITMSQDWLAAQPPRSEADLPSITAAKQLADETCQFASSISAAVKVNHTTAAYANLRPLVDRLFHAARFFEDPMDAMAWAYWSNAEFHRLLSAVLQGGSVNPENRDGIRDLLRSIRRWNRDLAGHDQPMRKPGAYAWSEVLDVLTKDAHPRLKSAYSLTSTYVHPTYRQVAAPDLGVAYLLSTTVWVTAATVVICAASLAQDSPVLGAYPVDSNLRGLIDPLDQFLASGYDLTWLIDNPPLGIEPFQVFYMYAGMLLSFIFDRQIMSGLPRVT